MDALLLLVGLYRFCTDVSIALMCIKAAFLKLQKLTMDGKERKGEVTTYHLRKSEV